MRLGAPRTALSGWLLRPGRLMNAGRWTSSRCAIRRPHILSLTVVDDYGRESLAIAVGQSITGERGDGHESAAPGSVFGFWVKRVDDADADRPLFVVMNVSHKNYHRALGGIELPRRRVARGYATSSKDRIGKSLAEIASAEF
jgi:hypothetical protein